MPFCRPAVYEGKSKAEEGRYGFNDKQNRPSEGNDRYRRGKAEDTSDKQYDAVGKVYHRPTEAEMPDKSSADERKHRNKTRSAARRIIDKDAVKHRKDKPEQHIPDKAE